MKIWEGKINASEFHVGVIVSQWNSFITTKLLEGALETLKKEGVSDDRVEVIKVPGCFEMPLAAQVLAKKKRFNALICLGAVIRGETTHHTHIGTEVSRGVSQVSLEWGIPIGFGVLTTENADQALARAGGKVGNKGVEAALAALEMASFKGLWDRDENQES